MRKLIAATAAALALLGTIAAPAAADDDDLVAPYACTVCAHDVTPPPAGDCDTDC